jgi:GDP-mannose 6-dehydrogenase
MMDNGMKIAIFGLGYVGCVSLGCLAQNGYKVIGIDVSRLKVDLINSGQPTIIEKDIDRIISEQHTRGMVCATLDYAEAVRQSDISIICVGTPSSETGHLNLDFVSESARQIGSVLKDKVGFHAVFIRSTVLPGTNRKVSNIIEDISGKKSNTDFAVVSNPEFLREGSAVQDYYNPPFTLIGTESKKAAEMAREVYSKVNGEFIRSSVAAAEIIKYVNNSYHALKVTFGNEIGIICKQLGIDSHEVMKVFCLDKQLNISPYYFKPGFAYGGSCLPKDLKALKTVAHDNYIEVPVLEAIESSNDNHISQVIKLIEKYGCRKIGILGIAFKQGTDDLRYSPIIKVIEYFNGKGYDILLHDDFVNAALLIGSNREYLEKHLPYIEKMMLQNEQDVVERAELVVFNRRKPEDIKMAMANPDKRFVDLVRISGEVVPSNVEGICW